MKMLKYAKAIGLIIVTNLVLSFIITLFHYFDIFSPNTVKTIKLFGIILSMLVGGFYIGMKSSKKGYLEGIKIGLTLILLFFLFTLISKKFELKVLVYYLIILISSIVGAMIGIQKKKDA